MTHPALVVRSDRIGYRDAWRAQERLAEARRAGAIPDVVWLLEHPPTFTTGRHGARDDLVLSDAALADAGAEFVVSDRGGLMTWHGPGQTVAYLVCDLRPRGRVRAFVDALVSAMADASGVAVAAPGADAVGLYVRGRKLGSLGLRVSRGVTTHGLALNRDPDLGWFSLITACGAPGVAATSIAAEGGDPTRARVEDALLDGLTGRLDIEPGAADLDDLLARATTAAGR